MHYERSTLGATFLPVGQLLQLDRVTGIGGASITAELDITPDHWAFPLHFPGDPVFPGCLLIEAAGQLVMVWGWEVGLRGRPRLARANAEFKRPVLATDRTLILRGTVRRRRNMCFGAVTCVVGDETVATIEAVIAVVEE